MAKYKVKISSIDTNQLIVLNNETIKRKIKDYQMGDMEAYNDLIEGNLRLVLSVVQKFAERCDNLDDLFQIGCIGLIKSIQNFNLDLDVRFSTYAVPMIKGEIKRFLRDNSPVKISRQLKDLAYQSLKAKEIYLDTYHQEPTNEQIGKLLGASTKQIDEALESIQTIYSIYEPVFEEDGEPLYLIDQIRVEDDRIFKIGDLLTLKKGLEDLNDVQKRIINERYYLDRTQGEIAMELNISQAQVSRLEKNALEVLRNYF